MLCYKTLIEREKKI